MNVEDLKGIGVFSALSVPVLEHLLAAIEELRFENGELIFAEGDEGNAVYFLRGGHVRAEKRIQAGSSEARSLSVMGPGDFFGEMSLFDGQPRSASTVAVGDVRLYRITREAFQRLLAQDHAAGAGLLFAIIRTCHQRIRTLSSKVVVFHEIGRAIGESSSLPALTAVVLSQLREGTGAVHGAIALKLEFFDRFDVAGALGPDWSSSPRNVLMQYEELIRRVATDRKGVRLAEAGEGRPGAPGMASMIVEPVLQKETMLGVVLLGHPDPDHFTADDLTLCASVAGQIAPALLNFRHREEEQMRSRLGRQFVRF